MIQNFRFRNIIICLSLAFVVSSCSKSFSDKYPNAPVGVAYVSVVHAAPQTGSLQFSFDQNRVNIDIFNFTDRVNYLNTFAGSRRFAAFLKGSTDTLVAKNITVQSGKNYTVFIADVPGKTDAVLVRDSSRAPGGDSVRIRFANMSPNIGNLDLYINGHSEPIATNVNFKTASNFISIKAMNEVTLEARRSGQNTVIAKSLKLNLVSGNYYTVWSAGLEEAVSEMARLQVLTFRH